MKSKRIRKIGLLGPFGYGNLGDAAIQQAMIQNIRKYHPGAVVVGFSLYPEDTYQRHGIDTYPLGRMAAGGWAEYQSPDSLFNRFLRKAHSLYENKSPFARLLRKALILPIELLAIIRASKHLKGMDLLIISGGGQLDDYWGGAFNHPYTLLLWGILAKLRGIKFLFVSQGAGPLDSPVSRFFDRCALSLASYRSFRDAESRAYMQNAGFFRDDPVYPDLAFSLDTAPYLPSAPKPGRFKGVVGIAPMSYFDPRVWPEKDSSIYRNYMTKLAAFTAWLMEQNYAIRLYKGDAVYERPVIADFRNILSELGACEMEGQIIEEPINTVDDLMRQLAAVDLVVASRFHGVLLPLLLKKPVLAVSYHPKIDALMKDTGVAEYCLSIDRFETEQLKERFVKLERNRENVIRQIDSCVGAFQKALNEQYEGIYHA